MRSRRYQYNRVLKTTARSLRKTQNNAELFLWLKLRNRQILGFKFRRQFPIGPYIVDFYCPKEKLVIELDGGQHADSGQGKYDIQRTKVLEKFGIKVVRFWNNEVFKNTNGVLEEIISYLQKTSP